MVEENQVLKRKIATMESAEELPRVVEKNVYLMNFNDW